MVTRFVPRRCADKRAFSLIEVLVVAGILFIVLGVMYNSYIQGLDIQSTLQTEADLQASAKVAMARMVGELRNATRTSTQHPPPNLSITSGPNQKEIHFYLPEDRNGDHLLTDTAGEIEWGTNNQIDYTFIPGLKILRRSEKGNHLTLALNVSEVDFYDITSDPTLANNEIKIILTLIKTIPRRGPISATVSAVVSLRN